MRFNEELENHPYSFYFLLTNHSDNTFTVQLGSEGVIKPITKSVILKLKIHNSSCINFKIYEHRDLPLVSKAEYGATHLMKKEILLGTYTFSKLFVFQVPESLSNNYHSTW